MLAREVERFDAVARTDRVVAVGFQQIVEELHIELVVLHDQDGLGHPPLPLVPGPMRSAPWRGAPVAPPRKLVPKCYGKANHHAYGADDNALRHKSAKGAADRQDRTGRTAQLAAIAPRRVAKLRNSAMKATRIADQRARSGGSLPLRRFLPRRPSNSAVSRHDRNRPPRSASGPRPRLPRRRARSYLRRRELLIAFADSAGIDPAEVERARARSAGVWERDMP